MKYMSKPFKIFIKVLLLIIGIIVLVVTGLVAWDYKELSSMARFEVDGRLGNIGVANDTLHIMCAKGNLDIKSPAPIDQLNTLLPTLIETCGKNANAMLLYGTDKKAYDVLFQTSSKFNQDEQYYFVYLQKLIPQDERADLTLLVYKSDGFEEEYREVISDVLSFIPDAEDSITFKDFTDDGRTDAFVRAPVVKDWGWRLFILNPDDSLSAWKLTSTVPDGSHSIRDGVPYYAGKQIVGVDPESFTILGMTEFSKDKNKVYYQGVEAPEYDVATIEVLENDGSDYLKDRNGVYYRFPYSDGWQGIPYDRIEGADPSTFEMIEGGYAKDKNRVYNNTRIIEGADPKTFELISDEPSNSFSWSKDAYHVFKSGVIVEGAQPSIFKVLGHMFGIDAEHVFSGRYLIVGADPATFEIINSNYPAYGKDKNHVYASTYNEENPIMVGADPETFEMLEPPYSRDKDHIFIYARMIPEADVNTFEILDYSYSRDKNHVYTDGSVVEDEDPATFSTENR